MKMKLFDFTKQQGKSAIIQFHLYSNEKKGENYYENIKAKHPPKKNNLK